MSTETKSRVAARTSQNRTNQPSEPWLRALSRVAFGTAAFTMALFVTFAYGLGRVTVPERLAGQYSDQLLMEFFLALQLPLAFTALGFFDILVWLFIGATLVVFAGLVAERFPIRSRLLTYLGIGHIVGAVGGALRLFSIGDAARAYASASPEVQTALLQSAEELARIVPALFGLGNLLTGLGFLLAASVAVHLAAFPRWLTIWIGFLGVAALALFGVNVIAPTAAVTGIVFFVYLLVGLVGVHLALAAKFWRTPVTTEATEFDSSSV